MCKKKLRFPAATIICVWKKKNGIVLVFMEWKKKWSAAAGRLRLPGKHSHCRAVSSWSDRLVHPELFKISHHIESRYMHATLNIDKKITLSVIYKTNLLNLVNL